MIVGDKNIWMCKSNMELEENLTSMDKTFIVGFSMMAIVIMKLVVASMRWIQDGR